MIRAIALKGTDGARLAIRAYYGTDSADSRFLKVENNFLSSATAKSKSILFERITPNVFKQIEESAISLAKMSDALGLTYANKLQKVGVGTSTATDQITDGTIEIYGRKRM